MKVDVPVRAITIKDENTGESITIKTLRSAKEIGEMIQEIEKEIIADRVEAKVNEELAK